MALTREGGTRYALAMDAAAAAQAYRQRSKDEHAAREATRRSLLTKVVAVLRTTLPPGTQAWIFGSLANGDFGARSDVDVAVTGVPAEALGPLERTLVTVTGRLVDLLSLETLPTDFRDRIVREGLLVLGDAR